jgi:polyribonucleotide nucleotidyltransferase
MQELGWINMENKKVEWLLPHPPTKATAIHLMDFATARTNQYNTKARAKRNQEVSEIKFDEKQELKPEAEERFTWGEWLERLKNNPVYEYRLTRVKRSTEPEVIL